MAVCMILYIIVDEVAPLIALENNQFFLPITNGLEKFYEKKASIT